MNAGVQERQVTTALIAILPVIGALIGAALQYAFGRSLEAGKQLSSQRAQSYIDFFRAVAALAQGRSKDKLTSAVDAKSRICLYGSSETIKRLADFERSGAVLTRPEGKGAFLLLLEAMRKDAAFDRKKISRSDLHMILFRDP